MIDRAAQRSREFFASGFYCAESVLLAIAEAEGIHSDLIPGIATGFCSGIARTCGTCGALSGRNSPQESAEENYAAVRELIKIFEREFGSTNCQELTGCDLGTEKGHERFRAHNMVEQCYQYAETATRIAMTLVKKL